MAFLAIAYPFCGDSARIVSLEFLVISTPMSLRRRVRAVRVWVLGGGSLYGGPVFVW